MRAARLRRLGSESVVYGLSGIATRFLMLALVPVYTRTLSTAEFGRMSLVAAALSVASVVVVLGLDNAAHRWYWDDTALEERRRTIASWTWCQLSAATVAAVAAFSAARPLAQALVGDADEAPAVRLAALTLPLGVLGMVVVNWTRMQRRPWATLSWAVSSAAIVVTLTIVMVRGMRLGVVGVFGAQAAAAGIASLAGIAVLRGWVDPRHVEPARLRAMLRFALPMIPAAVALWIVNFADRFFIERYTDATQVGLYSLGATVASLVAVATGAFQQAWGPFAYSLQQEEGARQTYADVYLVYVTGAGALSAGVAVFAPELLRLFATAAYADAAPVVALLAPSYVLIGLTYVAGIGASLARTTAPAGLAVTMAALLNIALNLLLVPRYGKLGSAAATLTSQALAPWLLFRRSQALYAIPYRFGAGTAILAGSALAGVVLQRVALASPLLTVLAKAALLLLAFVALGALAGFPFRRVLALARSPRASAGSAP